MHDPFMPPVGRSLDADAESIKGHLEILHAELRAMRSARPERHKILIGIAAVLTALLGGGGAHSCMQTPALQSVREDVSAMRAEAAHDREAEAARLEAQRERWKITAGVLCQMNGQTFAEDVDCRAAQVEQDPAPLGSAHPPARVRALERWPSL